MLLVNGCPFYPYPQKEDHEKKMTPANKISPPMLNETDQTCQTIKAKIRT